MQNSDNDVEIMFHCWEMLSSASKRRCASILQDYIDGRDDINPATLSELGQVFIDSAKCVLKRYAHKESVKNVN